MATKCNVTVGYFLVTSYCRQEGSETEKISLDSSNVDHVIQFGNGSKLPYDLQAKSIQSVMPAQIDFSYGGGTRDIDWQAQRIAIGPGDNGKDAAVIHVVANSRITARMQTPTTEYRLDSSVSWPDDRTYTGLLEIKMDVG